MVESAKPAIAIVIIYAIAFYMGWEKPYWAAVSAASVNLLTHGMTLYRGLIRVAGTFVGGFTGLAVIALFPQERWAYQTAAMVPIFLFGYGCSGKNDYFWVVSGITFMVVIAVAWTVPDWDSGVAHQIVMLRITQTWMGSLVMVLVNVYVWPKSSLGDFEDIARQGWATQRRLYKAVRGTLAGEDRTEEARQLRLQDVELMERAHFVLHMAEHDSFEILETGHHWHQFLHQSGAQVEGLENLRESLADVRGLDLSALLPGLDALCRELERRFEQTERMLADRAPTSRPQPVTLSANEAEIQALPRFQQTAVTVIKAQFESLEAVSRSLFDCMAEIRMFSEPSADHGAHGGHAPHGSWLALDPDRALSAVANIVTVWVAFLCWIYIYDVPVGPLFWAMTGIFTFIMGYRGEVKWTEFYWSWGIGTVIAGVCYVFIMQHLSGYRELGVLIFVCCFLMFFVFFPLAHPVGRMFALISYTIVLSADNHQHYSLEHFITYALWLFLVISISLGVRAFFFYPRPDKMFLRFFDRFFRHAYLLLSAHGPEGPRPQGILHRLSMIFYRNDLSELPRKCALYASDIDVKMNLFGRGTVDYRSVGAPRRQVEDLLMSLYLLTYRTKDVLEARELPRMDLAENQLMEAIREWHQLIEEWFRCRAAGTVQAMELVADVPARLAKLGPRVDEAFARIDQGQFSAEDRVNFYRLLNGYRGLSEAVINHARVAETVDWPRWRETRF